MSKSLFMLALLTTGTAMAGTAVPQKHAALELAGATRPSRDSVPAAPAPHSNPDAAATTTGSSTTDSTMGSSSTQPATPASPSGMSGDTSAGLTSDSADTESMGSSTGAADTDTSTTTGTGSTTSTPAAGNAQAASTARITSPVFVGAMAAMNTYEIRLAELALQKSQTPKIRTFAQQMKDAHTKAMTKLETAAKSADPTLKPVAGLAEEHTATLQRMGQLSGTQFDAAFTTEQIAVHEYVNALLQEYTRTADKPALKTFAEAMKPEVAGHLATVKTLNQ